MFSNARRLLGLLALVIIAFASCLAAPASAQIPYINMLFNEPRYAAIVVDANTGEVLYEKHADSPRYPASITKLMTLYLTFEALNAGKLSLSDRVPISAHAESMAPTKLGLRVGDSVSVDEAIRAAAVKSANDMAVALAEKVGGTEAKFTALMTLRAKELGMTNTQYVNACGLPDSRQITTARDLAILSRALMRDFPQYYSYFGLHEFTFRGQVIRGHNHLLDSMPGADGLKTGYTATSGFNLAASATQNGRRLIAVVLGGSSVAARDINTEDLLKTGFEVLHRRDLGEKITVAQNLFEAEPTGQVLRPPTEQGDADQAGVKILLGDEANRPLPPVVEPAQFRTAVETCAAHKVVRYVKGRHGKRTRVVASACSSARLTHVSVTCAKKGHHGHACPVEKSSHRRHRKVA
jgi:D-alanyl-D-alanine carboxypeptidase (penicillin-binding protein 5/6)